MGTHPGVYVGVFIGIVGVLLTVILVPLSFRRVAFDEVAIKYDKVSRALGDETLNEGLHNVGPSGELLKFKTTQRTADVRNLLSLTNDGIQVHLDVQVAYTIDKAKVADIVDEFTSQEDHDDYLLILAQTVTRDTSVKFTARSFFLQRQDFQSTLLTDMQQAFTSRNVHAAANIVQVVDIRLPLSVESALQNTTVAEQDVQNALTERAQDVQEAEIRLNLTKAQADLKILEAQREVDKILQDSEQAVLAERTRILTRTYAFSNISSGLGKGGDFFVTSYLTALVTQSNTGKTIIGL